MKPSIHKFEQIISCPNCGGTGWVRDDSSQCPVCEARGLLVIDGKATMARPMQPVHNRTVVKCS